VLAALREVHMGDLFAGSGMGGTHRQLSALLGYLEGQGDIDFNMSNEEARDAEREMRRLFGACVAGSGDRLTDRSGVLRVALQWGAENASHARRMGKFGDPKLGCSSCAI